MRELIERLNRLGLIQAAQIVEKYAKQSTELHAARQEIIALKREIKRLGG